MKLKVCGMKYKDNINSVATLQPDYMGFIFYEKSSRYFDEKIPQLPKDIKKTGVFVNEDLETVNQLIKMHNLQAVQLHGKESPEYCKQLSSLNVEIIKVFSIRNTFNFDVLKPYEGIVDYFLFDTKGKLPGGNGYTFNWDILKNYPSETPYFLSGGIGLHEIENIKEFKKNPASKYCFAIDVNSKFEIEPGLKNRNELEKFKHEL